MTTVKSNPARWKTFSGEPQEATCTAIFSPTAAELGLPGSSSPSSSLFCCAPCDSPHSAPPRRVSRCEGWSSNPRWLSAHLQSINVLERTASSSTEPSISRQLLEPEPIPLSKVSECAIALTGSPVPTRSGAK